MIFRFDIFPPAVRAGNGALALLGEIGARRERFPALASNECYDTVRLGRRGRRGKRSARHSAHLFHYFKLLNVEIAQSRIAQH